MAKATCPTRIDLAGGTLDLWPIYAILGKAYTINFAIDLCSHVDLNKRSDLNIYLSLNDLGYQKTFSSLKDVFISSDKEIGLIKEVLKYFNPDFGFELAITAKSPIGAGLGGSSSLLMGLLEAFNQVLDKKQSLLSQVNLAHNIEACFLGQPTGTQDYFVPALKTGTVVISYDLDDMSWKHIKTSSVVKDKCLLVDTGRSHNSGWNNWSVLKDFVNGDIKTRKVIERIAKVSEEMYFRILNQKLDHLEELFIEEFSARMSLTETFSSPEIQELRKCIPASSAIKICGAGGGGCVMIWTDEKENIREICHQKGYQVLDVNFP